MAGAVQTEAGSLGHGGAKAPPSQGGLSRGNRAGSLQGLRVRRGNQPADNSTTLATPITHLVAGAAVPACPAINRAYGGLHQPVDENLLTSTELRAGLLFDLVEAGFATEPECLAVLQRFEAGEVAQSHAIGEIVNTALEQVAEETGRLLVPLREELIALGFDPDDDQDSCWESQFSLDEDAHSYEYNSYHDDSCPMWLTAGAGHVAALGIEIDHSDKCSGLIIQMISHLGYMSEHAGSHDLIADESCRFFVLGELGELDDDQLIEIAGANDQEAPKVIAGHLSLLMDDDTARESAEDNWEAFRQSAQTFASALAIQKNTDPTTQQHFQSFCNAIDCDEAAPDWLRNVGQLGKRYYDWGLKDGGDIRHRGDCVYDFLRPIALNIEGEFEFLEAYHQTAMMGGEGAEIAIKFTKELPAILANLTVAEWLVRYIAENVGRISW